MPNPHTFTGDPELPPLGGAVFIFFSKNRQQVKMLKWDGDGFLLYQKRLERGTFELPFFDPKNKQLGCPVLCSNINSLV